MRIVWKWMAAMTVVGMMATVALAQPGPPRPPKVPKPQAPKLPSPSNLPAPGSMPPPGLGPGTGNDSVYVSDGDGSSSYGLSEEQLEQIAGAVSYILDEAQSAQQEKQANQEQPQRKTGDRYSVIQVDDGADDKFLQLIRQGDKVVMDFPSNTPAQQQRIQPLQELLQSAPTPPQLFDLGEGQKTLQAGLPMNKEIAAQMIARILVEIFDLVPGGKVNVTNGTTGG